MSIPVQNDVPQSAENRDRYYAVLSAPRAYREDLFALVQFADELAAVPDRVREPALGQIRLQWWRDSVDGLFDNPDSQPTVPVLAALSRAVHRRELSRTRLMAMIDAREQDVAGLSFEDISALVRHADGVAGELAVLMLEVVGETKAHVQAAARDSAIAAQLADEMRALPTSIARGRVYLPMNACRDGGVDLAHLQTASGALQGVVTTVCGEARNHLQRACAQSVSHTRSIKPALMPMVFAYHDLRALKKSNDDPFVLEATRAGAKVGDALVRQWRVGVYALLGQV